MIFLSRPRYISRIWGSLPGMGSTVPVGEIWWLFHDETGSSELLDPKSSVVHTVEDLVSSGRLPGGQIYPVLLKTLHTSDRLSLQVHPGIGGSTLFKEETWIVLSASEGAWMMGGLRNPERRSFFDSIGGCSAEELLERINLRKGDIYHIPPGTVHALGPGLEVLEVQSNCNVTYRLFDWGRTGADGKSRQLHLEKGMEAIDWSSCGKPVPAGKDGRIDGEALDCCRYRISEFFGQVTTRIPAGSLFFLSAGRSVVGETEFSAPACLVADNDGGVFRLRGRGYIVESGG